MTLSDIHAHALRHVDRTLTNFAAIESELEIIQKQLARLPDAPGASEDRA